MNWNNGAERKAFEERMKKQAEWYRKEGMTEEQIQAMYEFDLREFKSNRREIMHTVSLNCCIDDFDDDTQNYLAKTYLQSFTAGEEINYSNRYWWIGAIDNDDLAETVEGLLDCEKEIITLLVYEGYSVNEIANDYLHISPRVVYKKIERIRKKLSKFSKSAFYGKLTFDGGVDNE